MKKVVKLTELLADGLATEDQLWEAIRAAGRVACKSTPSEWSYERKALWSMAWSVVGLAGCGSFEALQNEIGRLITGVSDEESLAEIAFRPCDLLREIVVNQFYPVALNPAWLRWREATIPSLAQAIYDECAFDRLPILADALEDAGCTNEDILNHCRQPGQHVRGCWVVDLLLGKE
jgi:hypothetical protein